jgi:hypothetical protein
LGAKQNLKDILTPFGCCGEHLAYDLLFPLDQDLYSVLVLNNLKDFYLFLCCCTRYCWFFSFFHSSLFPLAFLGKAS